MTYRPLGELDKGVHDRYAAQQPTIAFVVQEVTRFKDSSGGEALPKPQSQKGQKEGKRGG